MKKTNQSRHPTDFVKYLVAVASVILLHAGCGKSEGDLAVERLKAKGKPAMVRIVNLADQPLDAKWKEVLLDKGLPVFAASTFRPVGQGSQSVDIEESGNGPGGRHITKSLLHDFKSGESYSIVVWRNGDSFEFRVVDGEDRVLQKTENLTVRYVSGSEGTPFPEVTLKSGSQTIKANQSGQRLSVPSGTLIAHVEGSREDSTFSVKDGVPHTLILARPSSNRVVAVLFANVSDDGPVSMGAAGT